MSVLTKMLVLLVIMFTFNANAAQDPKGPLSLSDLPFRQNNFDFRLAWKTSRSDDGIVIDGKMKNIHFMSVTSLELTVFLRGKDGKVRARATVLPMPQYAKRYDVVDFNLKIKNAELMPGDVLEFVIPYKAQDGSIELDWRSTFAADAMTGVPAGKENTLPAEW